MNLSSLNVDVLLHLIGFVKPVDCFNLALSGILKGFGNINEGVILHERYSQHFILFRVVIKVLSAQSRLLWSRAGATSGWHVRIGNQVNLQANKDGAVWVRGSTAAPTVDVVRTTNMAGANFETNHGAL